jgi:nickel superoxide dismutase
MSTLTRWLAPKAVARAHCDLPCGVYDPEQARIEAESVYKII